VQRNTRDWLGLVGHDHDAPADEDGYAPEDLGEFQDGDGPDGQLAMGTGVQIAVVRPRNFQGAITAGEYYRQEIPVIINLEDVDHALATRIIDFVSGLVLGLRGDIERLSRRAFLIVPAGASILTAHEGLTEEGFFNQALRPTVNGSVPLRCPQDATLRPQHDHQHTQPRTEEEQMRRSFKVATVFTGVAALAGGGYGPTALAATTRANVVQPEMTNKECAANNDGVSNWVHLYYPNDDHPAECFGGEGYKPANVTIASFCPGNNSGYLSGSLSGYPDSQPLHFYAGSGRNPLNFHITGITITHDVGEAKCG
jgi:cell division inhibitor SepF